jgi:hypothetical protein
MILTTAHHTNFLVSNTRTTDGSILKFFLGLSCSSDLFRVRSEFFLELKDVHV